jgi:hypothetical protein
MRLLLLLAAAACSLLQAQTFVFQPSAVRPTPLLFTPTQPAVGDAFADFSDWLFSDAGRATLEREPSLASMKEIDFRTDAGRSAAAPCIEHLPFGFERKLSRIASMKEEEQKNVVAALLSARRAAQPKVEAQAAAALREAKTRGGAGALAEVSSELDPQAAFYGSSVRELQVEAHQAISSIAQSRIAKAAPSSALVVSETTSEEASRSLTSERAAVAETAARRAARVSVAVSAERAVVRASRTPAIVGASSWLQDMFGDISGSTYAAGTKELLFNAADANLKALLPEFAVLRSWKDRSHRKADLPARRHPGGPARRPMPAPRDPSLAGQPRENPIEHHSTRSTTRTYGTEKR